MKRIGLRGRGRDVAWARWVGRADPRAHGGGECEGRSYRAVPDFVESKRQGVTNLPCALEL